ncbi:MAG: DUF3127 domain-containing protein, partial [Parvularcula sp.]|nr:DUF3127 domain-containing protein [Parvularcula sp.]
MSYEITGVIRLIEPEQQFPSGFSKREFVITTNDRFPQDVKLEFTKDKCAQLESFREGQPVKVFFNIRGNEYQGRFFVNLQAWKIEADGAQAQGYGQQSKRGYPPQTGYAPAPAQGGYPPAPRPAPAGAAAPQQSSFYGEEEDDV